ncbi:hypothetical protein BFP78_04160 [Gaetbulibacter sp. 5U11]|jgi:aspartokinase|nr:hypothetical protein BFP78_04160 [Gaetbulibacter sp. 5U11]
MKTIASCVEDILITQPFLEEALSRSIINYSALAEELNAPISAMLRKPVKSGAIMMALRRYNTPNTLRHSLKLKSTLQNLGDITVRSNLSDFTFQNSETLIQSHTKILDQVEANKDIFYAFTRGIFESNIIISSSENKKVLKCFTKEKQIGLQEGLSAISVRLPKDNSKISGLYYQIFKRLAWENIPIYEVVSTTNEFTVLVEDHVVDKAFSVIKNLKN